MENDENDESTERPNDQPYDLLSITKAYNRHEISLEEWLRLSRAWAEAIMRRHDTDDPEQPSAS